MCKESWLSGKNDSGGLVQLSKGYRLEDTDIFGSKMVDEVSSSYKVQVLDVDAIKAKHIELKNRSKKERVEDASNKMTPTLMYTSECPQCKGNSNKTVIAKGLTEQNYYVPRIKFSDDLSGIKNDIEIAKKERKKIKDKINEKRTKLLKLIEKAEKEEEGEKTKTRKWKSKCICLDTKEIDVLKTQIAKLKAGVGSSSGLEYWDNQITELEHKKTSYICENCKTGLEKDCNFCKVEYNKLENKKRENIRIVYPLLRIDLPVCNACVVQWGKEAILGCL